MIMMEMKCLMLQHIQLVILLIATIDENGLLTSISTGMVSVVSRVNNVISNKSWVNILDQDANHTNILQMKISDNEYIDIPIL